MSIQVNMGGSGTGAGIRKPWVGGHGPKCVCSKCTQAKEAKS